MIVVTGAAGFISSCLIAKLNQEGYNSIIAVDDFSYPEKEKNLTEKQLVAKVHRDDFFTWLDENQKQVEFIFHLGARTDTAEFDYDLLDRLNLDYTKEMWKACVKYQIPLVYASSAATYGGGEHGFDDRTAPEKLTPLNPYGESKNNFDAWMLQQKEQPFFWAGLKFFNVYGPNENHKTRMASVIWHTFNQIEQTGAMKLFQSHNPNYKNGEQMRDFIYVKDVVNVMCWFMHHRKNSGLYNLGTGKARTFLDLAKNTFKALGLEPKISFRPTPEDIRDKYQYFTEADMSKLKEAGYDTPFTELEEGVEDYVKNYLSKGTNW